MPSNTPTPGTFPSCCEPFAGALNCVFRMMVRALTPASPALAWVSTPCANAPLKVTPRSGFVLQLGRGLKSAYTGNERERKKGHDSDICDSSNGRRRPRYFARGRHHLAFQLP